MRLHYVALFMLLSCPASAQQGAMEKVLACADVVEASERHACFDALIPELKRARGALIGSTAPVEAKPPLQAAEFGESRAPASPLTAPILLDNQTGAIPPSRPPERVTLGLKSISADADGKLQFTMENGQVWKQVDTTRLRNLGAGPWNAEIRKAAFGSYLPTVDRSAAVRVERVN
jgi:hypothetical protein